MDELRKDLQFGVRMLRKRAGTTSLAIFTLALGIGLTTIMFSIVNGAFLRGLPFEEADRILYAGFRRADRPSNNGLESARANDVIDFRATQTAFDDVGAFSGAQVDVAAEGISPVRYDAAELTPNALHILRVRPALGRDFTEQDAVAGAPPVALIAESVWVNQFGRDPGILGKVIRVNGRATTVIGVMGGRFGFPQNHQMWLPLSLQAEPTRAKSRSADLFGRLKPGISAVAASLQMKALSQRVNDASPTDPVRTGEAIPFVHQFIGSQIMITLSTMLAAVFGVLLIACVNVTNLQLARAADRVREVGIRMAMGASRARLIRQLLVEGLILSLAGTAAGLAIAEIGLRLFMAGIADTRPPFWIVTNLDTRVLLFATLLTVVAALASSLAPAFRVTRQDLQSVLKDAGRANTSLTMGRFTRALVGAEIMLSFVLLVVSGLMIKSVLVANTIDYPFRADRYQARIELVERNYTDDVSVRQATDRLLETLNRTPGIARAAIATALPDRAAQFGVLVDGQVRPQRAQDMPMARRAGVTPEFFDLMGVSARQGRVINSGDRDEREKVAVVTEDFARKFFPQGGAIGRRLQLQLRDATDNPWWTVIGVVPPLTVSAKVGVPGDTSELVLVPMAQLNSRNLLMMAAASGPDPLAVAEPLRRAVTAFNADLPIFDADTVAGAYHSQTWPYRVFGSLFLSFGVAALVMAAAGLYGVMAFSVRKRTAEIGVRMALGADARTIRRMIMRQGVLIVGIGMTLGVGLGGWLGGQMQLLLFGVKPWDATVFGFTIAVLGMAGMLATYIPARRASSTDPLTALREE